MPGTGRAARVARGRGSRVPDFDRGRGSRGAGRRPPATLPYRPCPGHSASPALPGSQRLAGPARVTAPHLPRIQPPTAPAKRLRRGPARRWAAAARSESPRGGGRHRKRRCSPRLGPTAATPCSCGASRRSRNSSVFLWPRRRRGPGRRRGTSPLSPGP